MESTWVSQIESWNAQVRAGEGSAVAAELSRIARGTIPVEQLARIANLAWRVNRPEVGLRLLFTELRRQNSLKMETHPSAFTEYAACLLEVGAISEARAILRKLSGRTARSKFYYALLLFKEWDYRAACTLLEQYIGEIPADYHQLVTRINLASAYVTTGQWEKALNLFEVLRPELVAKNHGLLLGNSYEIESQIFFQQKDYTRALGSLTQSERYLEKTKSMGWLYCKKWQYINGLYLGKNPPKTELETLKKQALEMRSWETLRDLDLHTALRTSDSALMNHVYFGTAVMKYREKIRSLIADQGSPIVIEDSYVWGAGSSKAPQVMDLAEQVIGSKDAQQSYLMKKLLLTLVSDFYSPFRMGQLFSALFEGEFYDLETSPDRVFQIIRRLRAWLGKSTGTIQIQSKNEGYRIQIPEGSGIRLSRELSETEVQDKSKIHYLFLKENFADVTFTSLELGQKLNCSKRSANRILKELKAKGQVVSEGRGRFTRFKRVA